MYVKYINKHVIVSSSRYSSLIGKNNFQSVEETLGTALAYTMPKYANRVPGLDESGKVNVAHGRNNESKAFEIVADKFKKINDEIKDKIKFYEPTMNHKIAFVDKSNIKHTSISDGFIVIDGYGFYGVEIKCPFSKKSQVVSYADRELWDCWQVYHQGFCLLRRSKYKDQYEYENMPPEIFELPFRGIIYFAYATEVDPELQSYSQIDMEGQLDRIIGHNNDFSTEKITDSLNHAQFLLDSLDTQDKLENFIETHVNLKPLGKVFGWEAALGNGQTEPKKIKI